ncbi:MAG: helix-turn-helix domain-containing protein [Rudaea sp.]
MAVPRGGWSKAIRTALGMTLDDLADRLGITRSALSRMETSEQGETIQLDTLRRVAGAMNCDLVYALVPRQPLQEMVDQQRARAANELEAKSRAHMRLEGQEERDSSLAGWRKEHSASLISDRKLWKTRK